MAELASPKPPAPEYLRMTADVVAAYLRKNALPATQIADIIHAVYASLRRLEGKPAEGAGARKPAVPIRQSIKGDYLVCLEDGKKLKMLKRHLRTSYNLSPDQYRRKWGLPPDYPMVAPDYARQRSAFAKKIGLGRGRPAAKRAAPVTRK